MIGRFLLRTTWRTFSAHTALHLSSSYDFVVFMNLAMACRAYCKCFAVAVEHKVVKPRTIFS